MKMGNPLLETEMDSTEAAKPKETQTDSFDLKKLRLSQKFSEIVGVKKALLTVPVRRPGRQDFFRVRPGDDWHLETAVLELREERETYLVDPSLWHELPGELIPKVLFTTINRQGVLALWPIRLPGEDGRHDDWNRSAFEAAEIAMKRWVRLTANMSLGAYEVYEAMSDMPEPNWPELEFKEVLRISFKDRFIRSMDHPVIRRLRGEM